MKKWTPKKIEELKKYRENHTLKEVGKKYNLTSERIRQIINPIKLKICEKHKTRFVNFCLLCFIEKEYPKILNKIIKDPQKIKLEFIRLSKSDKTKITVLQKVLLIKMVVNKLNKSILEVSKLLRKDYNSVKYLYEKKIK